MSEKFGIILLILICIIGVIFALVSGDLPASAENVVQKEYTVDWEKLEKAEGWEKVEELITGPPLQLKWVRYRNQNNPEDFRDSLYWNFEFFASRMSSVWNLKNENGSWTEFQGPNEIKFFPESRVNGKKVFIVRIIAIKETELLISGNPPAKQIIKPGETLAARYFYY